MDHNNFQTNPLNILFDLWRSQTSTERRSLLYGKAFAGTFDAQRVFNKMISIESDRNVLKKELKYLFKLGLRDLFDSPLQKGYWENDGRFLFLAGKYNINLTTDRNNRHWLCELFWTFPDIAYYVTEKPPFNQVDITPMGYKNFKFSYFNEGLFGLLPAGEEFGGFVKALLHCSCIRSAFEFSLSEENFIDLAIEFGDLIYKSTVTSQNKRKLWFSKLNISAADCKSWSQIFDHKFPNYTNIHKRFDQVA